MSVNLQVCYTCGYCNKLVNLQNHTLTNVGHFYAKMYKFYIFFLIYTHSCECF